MKIYNDQIRDIVHNTRAPHKGFIFDIVELEIYPGLLCLQVYDENITNFSTTQQQDLSIYLGGIRDKIKSLGIQCEIIGAEYVPK